MASQCGIRGYLDWASYTRQGGADARKYRGFRVGLGDEIRLRRPNDSANGAPDFQPATRDFQPPRAAGMTPGGVIRSRGFWA